MNRVLKIAVVDDLESDRNFLVKKIDDYMDGRCLKYELLQYESGEAFVDALNQENFEIVFMDIFMSGINGITCAGKLRERDMDCKLVFLTTSKEFLEDGYAFSPCHYLIKPVSDTGFRRAMDNCRIKRQVAVPYLDVVSSGLALQIDTTEVMYLHTYKRNVFIHTTSGIVPAGRGFIGISQPLMEDTRFLLCIKGVLVNMDFIVAAEENFFLMKDGERMQIAMRERKNITRQYRTYQFERASDQARGG